MYYSKKICFLAPNLAGGGAERVVSILATYFADKNFKVDLLLAKAEGPYLNDLSEKVNIVNLNCEKMIYALPKIINYLKNNELDVLFSSQMHSSVILLWAAKLANSKAKIFIRQPTMLNPKFENRNLKNNLVQKIFLLSSNLADKIILSSKNMCDEYAAISSIPLKKLEIIYNPVPLDQIKKLANLVDKKLPNGLMNKEFILAVGRFEKVKGFEYLIKAFDIVKKSHDVNLLILGDGPLREDFSNLITDLNLNDYVFMPGFVSNPYYYMKRSKVFILSSLWEGFPNAMVEAMACGTPIVSTKCEGGAVEILENGKFGELVSIFDIENLAQAIIKKLTEKDISNVELRAADFSIHNICQQYERLFFEI